MATLSIGKSQRTIGAHNLRQSEAGTQQDAGILSRFASAAHVWADKYADYKYNQTDWRAIRP
ncbi:MAG: hypothetical protein IH873_07160 [Chloroflexi bacterium]|nr:hypothetical protein [Chloroflexota bacterium]